MVGKLEEKVIKKLGIGGVINLIGKLNARGRQRRRLRSIGVSWTVKPVSDDMADIDRYRC